MLEEESNNSWSNSISHRGCQGLAVCSILYVTVQMRNVIPEILELGGETRKDGLGSCHLTYGIRSWKSTAHGWF